jgi:hypothetical protein
LSGTMRGSHFQVRIYSGQRSRKLMFYIFFCELHNLNLSENKKPYRLLSEINAKVSNKSSKKNMNVIIYVAIETLTII